MCRMYTVYSGMQEWVIQIPSIPILVSVLFTSLYLKYFRIKFLLLVNSTISADWSTTKPIAIFSCTPRVQQVHTKAEVVHLIPGLLGLWVLFNCHVHPTIGLLGLVVILNNH